MEFNQNYSRGLTHHRPFYVLLLSVFSLYVSCILFLLIQAMLHIHSSFYFFSFHQCSTFTLHFISSHSTNAPHSLFILFLFIPPMLHIHSSFYFFSFHQCSTFTLHFISSHFTNVPHSLFTLFLLIPPILHTHFSLYFFSPPMLHIHPTFICHRRHTCKV
jgi:hypothetical protein